MKAIFQRHGPASALLALLLAAGAGCEEYCGTCGDPGPVVIVEPAGVPIYRYGVEVVVSDPAGFAVPGADVELIVAAVPETRFYGYTDGYGRAWFDVDAPTDVTLVAYVSAPGYASDAGDIGTYAGAQILHIPVCLDPAY